MVLYKSFTTYLPKQFNIIKGGVGQMSFIKVATSTLVSMGRKGYGVGKRLSKMTALNLTLKAERSKQQAYYQEIGEYIHIDKIDDTTNSQKIRTLREKITIQERKITRLIEEINLLKRINSCIHCGHISVEDNKYCPKCSRPRN